MPGKSTKRQKHEDKDRAVSAAPRDGDPVGNVARQTSGRYRLAQDGNFPSGGEIADPLGNFSEQVGAYFG